MTIKMLIKDLLNYRNLDAQVLDGNGSPIMWTQYVSPKESDNVRLGSKDQLDITEELDGFFANALEEGMTDKDALDYLFDSGYTMRDFKNYRKDVYDWALTTIKREY